MNYKKTYTVKEAKKLLENYCVYQERCHKDVEDKLNELGMIIEAKELIITHLLQHQFLNEERFAKAYVRGKFNYNKWGILKITQGLRFKKISEYNIKNALKEIDQEQYVSVANRLALKKFNGLKGTFFTKKQKTINYLASKGFEYSLVYEISNNLPK